MAKCTCYWSGVNRLNTDPDCPLHGEGVWTQEELDANREKARRRIIAFGWDEEDDTGPPAPGEGDDLPNPETKVEC